MILPPTKSIFFFIKQMIFSQNYNGRTPKAKYTKRGGDAKELKNLSKEKRNEVYF